MLPLIIPALESWDSSKEEFVLLAKEETLELEHSLVSLSKWESKWGKPFLSKQEKTTDETIDYIKCMTLTPNVDPDIYARLTSRNYKQINDYIEAPMTATTFSSERRGRGSSEIITSELIYYWMIALNIPFECQYWHLNRLLTLIKVCNVKNQPNKKMSKSEIMMRNRQLNEERKQLLNTKG